MKNVNNPKNRQTAENAERKGNEKQLNAAAKKYHREPNESNNEQVSSFNVNRGVYSRNGGDKGYRGL